MGSREENYYRVLGVAADASPHEVRLAYLQGLGDPIRLPRIRCAYEVLGSPQERARYDMLMGLGPYARRPRVRRTSYDRLFASLFAGVRAALSTMPTLVQQVEQELRRAG